MYVCDINNEHMLSFFTKQVVDKLTKSEGIQNIYQGNVRNLLPENFIVEDSYIKSLVFN